MSKSSDIERFIKPWSLPPKKNYVFTHANLVDVAEQRIIEDANIYVINGIIRHVISFRESSSDKKSELDDTEDYKVVDLEGKFVCPGFIDAHIHIVAVPGEANLKSALSLPFPDVILRYHNLCKQILEKGFTAVRDCGGAEGFIRNAIEEDIIHGPRLFFAGNALSQTGGHGDFRDPKTNTPHEDACACQSNAPATICDGADECLKAARNQLRKGADFIKIMAGGGVASESDKLSSVQFSPQEIQAIVLAANNHGTYVTAHAYTPQAIRQCVDNGVRGIEHGNLIDESTAKYMASRDAYLTPTLVTYKAMASNQLSNFLPENSRKKNEDVLESGIKSLAIARDVGVNICYGSDLLGPLHAVQTKEFVLRSSVCTPGEILQQATINPAKLFGMENELGQIKAGFYADLLVFNGNPLEDISILDSPERYLLVVMKGGRIYKSRWTKLQDDITINDAIL
ncbi:amidohydrolase [Schizosaccharomyces osmophilus]|uniref:Amidohydrolase n=1 Tax=Schizosaccharomyces osmophilus TaxID=2545709 RepID=A0AAE9WC46_9SCHI|nr:amidohydrolase [Schizosaccharomyces osmophilus]WBW73586.1 amidohydrolase [Schizosaccharomyces osmophilus]